MLVQRPQTPRHIYDKVKQAKRLEIVSQKSSDLIEAAQAHKKAAELRSQINQWVADNTEQNIKELIPENGVNELTRFVMSNAIYFKGQWQTEFEAKQTRPQDFHLNSGKSISVPMMQRSAKFDYLETENFQMVRLPYGKKQAAVPI